MRAATGAGAGQLICRCLLAMSLALVDDCLCRA
jgi:hypothetical protein